VTQLVTKSIFLRCRKRELIQHKPSNEFLKQVWMSPHAASRNVTQRLQMPLLMSGRKTSSVPWRLTDNQRISPKNPLAQVYDLSLDGSSTRNHHRTVWILHSSITPPPPNTERGGFQLYWRMLRGAISPVTGQPRLSWSNYGPSVLTELFPKLTDRRMASRPYRVVSMSYGFGGVFRRFQSHDRR
jgi:hypothetical protein